jgi:capsule polysaccharide export protein KpsC/LpsZ
MKKKTIASLADINELYEQSVQSPEAEIEFINRTYKSIFKHFPRIFREDFAGTSLLSTMWVQESKLNKAIAVDLDKDVLEWASNRNLSKLSEMERARIRFINEDGFLRAVTCC